MGWWNARKRWSVELPELDEPDPETPWRIGAIVGPSGSGKSVIARSHYGKAFVEGGYRWPASKAVVDGWPEKISVRVITGMLNSVGFSSPPDWIKPYGALNNGQRFRCDLARALFTDDELIAFDEFTSVVDRQVAQFGAAAVAKTLRKGRAAVRRFVAVTCHYDVLDWLQPDWVLDLGAGGRLARGWLRRSGLVASERPRIQLEVRTGDRAAWDMFSQHHYLSARLHHAARIYLGWWRGVLCHHRQHGPSRATHDPSTGRPAGLPRTRHRTRPARRGGRAGGSHSANQHPDQPSVTDPVAAWQAGMDMHIDMSLWQAERILDAGIRGTFNRDVSLVPLW